MQARREYVPVMKGHAMGGSFDGLLRKYNKGFRRDWGNTQKTCTIISLKQKLFID
jgi:hypothetical protein